METSAGSVESVNNGVVICSSHHNDDYSVPERPSYLPSVILLVPRRFSQPIFKGKLLVEFGTRQHFAYGRDVQ